MAGMQGCWGGGWGKGMGRMGPIGPMEGGWLAGGFAELVGGTDEGVVGGRGEDAVVMEGDDEMGVAHDGREVELLAGDSKDAVPA